MSRKLCRLVALAMSGLVMTVSGEGMAGPVGLNYGLTKTLPLDGPTRWDYLTFDAKEQRLFVTRGERVDVLDTNSGKVIGSIADLKGVHGVALAPELNRGYISDGSANSVVVFDLATLKPVGTIPVGTKPDAIVYDESTRRVFVANGGSGDLTAIDATTGMVVGSVELGGKPEFAVVNGNGQLFVNVEDRSQLIAVDTANLTIVVRYDLAPSCVSPTGLAIDIAQSRLFAVCRNKVMVVVDVGTGKIRSALPIGDASDAAIFDPESKLAFSSNGDGTLTVVDARAADHCEVAGTIATAPTARTMALAPTTHRIYLAAAETDGVDPPTAERPHPRPHFKPGSFVILTVEPKR
ncbi:MAG: YncE family protein [Alphaproteobacteria bacterium]|nr:YncE family protein [Alphaproteobacteria bacterium]